MAMDLVITWVGGEDPKWREEFENTYKKYYDDTKHCFDSATPNRFKNHGELYYLLLSIKCYLGWIRTIYIVASQNPPSCLDFGLFPNVKWVYHKDIFRYPKRDLPTFNSHAIEIQLHRIPGLSRFFIACNDDVFFSRPLSINDFVRNMDIPHPPMQKEIYDLGNDAFPRVAIHLDTCNSQRGVVTKKDTGFRAAWKNANALLDKWFPKRLGVRKKLAHTPRVCDRIFMSCLENMFQLESVNVWDQVSQSRFRSFTDINFMCSVIPYFMLYTEQAFLSPSVSTTLSVSSKTRLDSFVPKEDVSFLCLEDDHCDDTTITEFIVQCTQTLQFQMYPETNLHT